MHNSMLAIACTFAHANCQISIRSYDHLDHCRNCLNFLPALLRWQGLCRIACWPLPAHLHMLIVKLLYGPLNTSTIVELCLHAHLSRVRFLRALTNEFLKQPQLDTFGHCRYFCPCLALTKLFSAWFARLSSDYLNLQADS